MKPGKPPRQVCSQCQLDLADAASEADERVEVFRVSVGSLFDAAPRSALVHRPEPEVWSALEYAAHVADAVGWYCDRVERVLGHENAQLEPRDWDRFTESERYFERSTARVLHDVAAAGVRLRRLVDGLSGSELRRRGVGSDGSPRTIEQLLARAVHELVHHEQDIQRALTHPT